MTTRESIRPLRVLILRLSSIRDTAASSTHRLLADLVRGAAPEAEIDFAFLPPKRSPLVASHFTRRPLAAFDLILAVNAFVQEAVNLPWLLHANGIPAWANERPEDCPPILMGGSNALAAQCLARPDGTAVPDAFFFGEAEESLPRFIRNWQAAGGNKRARLLAAAGSLDGFWITGAVPDVPVRQAVARIPPPPASPLPLLDTDATGSVRLTVGLGCAAFCSFCFEGYERKPYREHAVDDLLDQARSLKRACGARTVELDAFNLNHYADLPALVERCARLFDKLAFKSQRADGVAACPEIIDLERAAGKGSFTLGIEGISARQRAFLAKSLTDADIASAIQALLARRVRELKLFFILTGHESAADLASFGEFCSRLSGWLAHPGACTRVVLSFGRLVRMPNTPLAFDRLILDDSAWRFAVDGVAAACRRARLEHRFAFDYPDYLGTQLLASCGHEHAEAVVSLACAGLSYHGPWRLGEAEQLRGALPVAAGAEARPSAFPFVRRAVSDAFLRRRWTEAQQALDTGYCLGTACLGCGACADAAESAQLTGRPRTPPVTADLIQTVARIEAEKRRLSPVYLRASLPDSFAGHSPAWAAASLMQRILACTPENIESLLAAEEVLFAAGDNAERIPLPAGETVVAVKSWAPLGLGRLSLPELNLRPMEGTSFAPGAFKQTDWDIRNARPPRDAAQACSVWLQEMKLPHTLRRDGECWRLELAPAALKKRIVLEAVVRAEDAGSCLRLTFTGKANVKALMPRLADGEREPAAVCIGLTL